VRYRGPMRATCLIGGSIGLLVAALSALPAQQAVAPAVPAGAVFSRCLSTLAAAKGFSGAVLVAQTPGGSPPRVSGRLDQWGYGAGISPDTKFYIASISKQFVAAALLKLAEAHRLRLDDPISKFIAPVPADKAGITLAQLLTHTSGLPQQYAADGIADREKAVQAVLAETLKTSPGAQFGYSNDGYSLLAAIVEIAAGEPYEMFVRRELLVPTGLASTGFWGDTVSTGPPIAPTIKPVMPIPNWGFRGATGMYSTVSDLYRWTRALVDHRILTADSTGQMLRPHVSTSRGGYGYGWFTSKTETGVDDLWTAGYEDFGHNGIIHVYGNGLVAIVLTNAGDLAGGPARDVADNEIARLAFNPTAGCGPIDFRNALSSTAGLIAHGVQLEAVSYRGRPAVRVVNAPRVPDYAFAIVPGTDLEDGTIDVDVGGQPEPGASPGARGFIGIAFRIGTDPRVFECFYIRPTNGRADDQLRRNHSTQYISSPEFPFDRLRTEAPGVYESYVDLVPGEWTHLRIAVAGSTARLFVNGAPEPTLLVKDLKHAPRAGLVGLWIGDETDGYFSRLEISPASGRGAISAK
jgi:CubicO group peptidase (beta-lactamase class C family)